MLQPYFAKVLDYHGSLISDAVRTDSYRRAISSVVKPGAVVLDVGTGVGVLALFACLAGASRVYAIESGRIIRVARELAGRNGFADRITFINEPSFDIRLPEPADVLITETVGNIGFDEGILGVVLDARARLVKPGAPIIPRALELHVAPLEAPEAYRRIDPWRAGHFGLDLAPVRNYAVNNLYFTRFSPEAFLGNSVCLGRVDLTTHTEPNISLAATLRIERAGTLHGLGGWFRSELTEDIFVSNAPELPATSWRHCFMPFGEPIAVEPGDSAGVTVECLSNGAFWRWSIDHRGRRLSGDVARGFPL